MNHYCAKNQKSNYSHRDEPVFNHNHWQHIGLDDDLLASTGTSVSAGS